MSSRSKKPMLVMASLVLLLMSVPLLNVQAEDNPWRFLTDFALVPESPALIEGHYIAALFVSQDKKELAVVIFNAICDSGNCEIHHRAAYSVFDRQGSNVRRYIDPGDSELLQLISSRLNF